MGRFRGSLILRDVRFNARTGVYYMSKKLTNKDRSQGMSRSEKRVSERDWTEKKVREGEKLFQSLTENSFAAAFVVQNGKFRYINTSAVAYAGYTAEDLIGKDSDIIVHPDDRAMVKEKAREMLQGRDPAPFGFRMVTKKGTIRSILQIVSPIQYDGKQALLGNAIDVTQRKKVEEALRESERRLADIIDFLPDATLAIDRKGTVIAWNRAMEDMTGVKAENMLGKGNYEYALPFYGKRSPLLIDQVLKPDKKTGLQYHTIPEKEQDILIVETWVPSLKGKKAFLWAKASPLYDSKGELVGAIESMRDITKRKEAEKMLQESEEKYRSLASTVDLMYLVDKDCRYLFMNEGHLSRFGIPLDKMEGRFYNDFHLKEDAKEFADIVKRIFETGQAVQHEHLSGRDGRYFLRTLSPVKDSDGRTTAVTVVSKDITVRTRVEEALRESERRLADIIDFLPDATLAIDLTGKVIAWNHAIEEMTGVKASDILGKGDYEYALPFYGIRRPILADLVLKPDKKIERSYYSILEKNKDLLIVETWVPFLKWKKAFLWAKASPLYDSKGDIVGAIESIRDITERKEAEKMLQESEEKYRSLASSIDLMYLVDKDCRYLFMNEGLLSRFGISLGDMEGKSYDDFHSEEDAREFTEIIGGIFKMGQAVQHEHKSERDDKYFLRSLSPVKDSEGRTIAVTVVSKDITKRKMAEEALRESERRLSDIIDFLPDATLAINRKGNVIAWNRAIEEMTGVKAFDILGKGDYEYALPFYGIRRPILIDLVLKPDKKFERSYYSVFKKEEAHLIVETWVPALKDKRAFLWAKASPLYDSKGRIVGAIESIRDITVRKQAEEMLEKREIELEAKTNELEDLNAALRVLLKQREEDKNELEQKVLSNVKLLILPYIEKLKSRIDLKGSSYVNILESNLREIVSPFAQKLSVKYLNLTNREVQIANLIKEGKTTKEIAALLNVSESAVNVYRYHIRRKLSLTKKHNLRSYLST
jgi:PAS domain S-box-containing protein